MNTERISKLVLTTSDQKILLQRNAEDSLHLPRTYTRGSECLEESFINGLNGGLGIGFDQVVDFQRVDTRGVRASLGDVYAGRTDVCADELAYILGQNATLLGRGEVYGNNAILRSEKVAIVLADRAIKRSPLR